MASDDGQIRPCRRPCRFTMFKYNAYIEQTLRIKLNLKFNFKHILMLFLWKLACT